MTGHAGIIAFDGFITSFLADGRVPILTEFFVELTALGSVTFMGILVLSLWFLRKRDLAVLTGTGIIVAGGAVTAFKHVIGRARPDIAGDILRYTGGSYAFPSGHATLVFVAATILAGKTTERGFHALLYTLAVLIAFSRVYLGVHYLTDVLAGAVLGLIIGRLVLRYQDRILAYASRLYSL